MESERKRRASPTEVLAPSARKRRASPTAPAVPPPLSRPKGANARTDCGARLQPANKRALSRLPEHLQALVIDLSDSWAELPDKTKAAFFALENPTDDDLELLCSSVPSFQRFCQSKELDWFWRQRLGLTEDKCWYDVWRDQRQREIVYIA
jgi:hypothetical protein